MRNLVKVLAVFLLVFIVGCSDDDGTSVADSVLKGKVFGVDFTAKGGKAFKSGTSSISVNITNVVVGCSSRISEYGYRVSTIIKEEGISKVNVVLSKKGENPLNLLESTVIVESITDSSIVLRIKAGSRPDNTVEGKFTVPYCK